MQLPQDLQPVQLWQKEVEYDEVPSLSRRQAEPFAAVAGRGDRVSLGLQPTRQKRLNAGLVLDDQDAHAAIYTGLR